MQTKTHYQLLGISPTADEAEIRRAYDVRMQQLAGSGSVQQEAVRKAHAVLADPIRRAVYDASLRNQDQGMTPPPAPVARREGAGQRWLMVLAGVALLGAGLFWLSQRPKPAAKPALPVASEPAIVVDGIAATPDEIAEANASIESAHNGLWQRKWAERTDVEDRLSQLQREMDIARLEGQRSSVEEDADAREAAERQQAAWEHEQEWLKARLEAINASELAMAKQGTLAPIQRYTPPGY